MISPQLPALKLDLLAEHLTDSIRKVAHLISQKYEIVRRFSRTIQLGLAHFNYSFLDNDRARMFNENIARALGLPADILP